MTEQEPTKENFEAFHHVLKLAREQTGSGSDLDILYRYGYWEAVKDHTRAMTQNHAMLAELDEIQHKDKPTVPLAMLSEVAFYSRPEHLTPDDILIECRQVAVRFGYEVTE